MAYEDASYDEKIVLAEKANAFTQSIDNIRRKATRDAAKVAEHESTSLDGLIDAGYDPTLDAIEVAIEISHKVEDTNGENLTEDNIEDDAAICEDAPDTSLDEDFDDAEYAGKKNVSRGRYESFNDLNNPEYIVAKTILYSKLHALVDELDGEDLAIATAIMDGVSERKLAEELDVPLATLQRHRKKLMARFRDILGEDNNF